MKIIGQISIIIFIIGLFIAFVCFAVHASEEKEQEDFDEFKQMPTYTGKVVSTYDAHSNKDNNKITLENTKTHERQSFYASDVALLRNPKGNNAKFKYNPATNLIKYDYNHQKYPKNADEYRKIKLEN